MCEECAKTNSGFSKESSLLKTKENDFSDCDNSIVCKLTTVTVPDPLNVIDNVESQLNSFADQENVFECKHVC